MRAKRILVAAALLCVGLPAAAASGPSELWLEKVHPRVLEAAGDGEPVEFLVFLELQADLAFAESVPSRDRRGRQVVDELRKVAASTQAPLIERLEQLGAEYRPFWIANMIWVRGDRTVLRAMAERATVRRIDANPVISLPRPERTADVGSATRGTIEWNVEKIRAPAVWALGYDGSGIVVGGQDTGYLWSHPAIRATYRGWDGQSADHDYNWHDSIHSGGGSCGADSLEPCDDHGHGTHTMGTITGDDGGTNRVGVAPGASWIGCRNMDRGDGTPATYSECFEWFVAPTDLSGQNPDPARAPHVINNSWSCPPDEGCEADTLRTVVENVRAAGIVVVVSAGNSGGSCSSVSNPPAIYEASFSVGATNSGDGIASFSSRGPVTVDESGRIKPDVSAPGVSVRSSTWDGGYGSKSGTSMAGPHVAALVALLLDARPDLIGDVDAIETLIEQAAVRINSSQVCGGITGSEFPNNTYGHGRIDALETILGDADDDGSDNLTDCRPADPATWAPPGPANDLVLTRTESAVVLSWDSPSAPGTIDPDYDVLRSGKPDDFTDARCLSSSQRESTLEDPDPSSEPVFYLVRARSDCGSHLGHDSTGEERSGALCLDLQGP